jgi:hypothetical protein
MLPACWLLNVLYSLYLMRTVLPWYWSSVAHIRRSNLNADDRVRNANDRSRFFYRADYGRIVLQVLWEEFEVVPGCHDILINR